MPQYPWTSTSRIEDEEALAIGRCRSGRVRMSVVSKESFVLLSLLGGIILLFMADRGPGPGPPSGAATLHGHEGAIESLAFARDGKMLVSCGWDRTVRTWELGEGASLGRELDTLSSGSHMYAVAISPDGRMMAAGGTDSLHVWNRDGEAGWIAMDLPDRGSHHALAMSADGGRLAVGCADGTIRLWDVAARKPIDVLTGFTDEPRKLEFSPDGELLGGTTFKGEFMVWRLPPGGRARKLGLELPNVQTFSFSLNSRSVAIAEFGPDLKSLGLWDLETGNRVLQYSDNADGTNALAFSPDGRTLASGDVGQSISFWDVATGQLQSRLRDGVGWVKTLAYSPDGRRIAFGGKDCAIRMRDLEGTVAPAEAVADRSPSPIP